MKVTYARAVQDEIQRLNGNRTWPVLYPDQQHGPLLIPAWAAELARRTAQDGPA